MKAVIMAVQNLTVAFGDLIVIILIPICAALFGDNQVTIIKKQIFDLKMFFFSEEFNFIW
jgi:hypothetical protein